MAELTADGLNEVMESVADSVQPWSESGFVFVGHLQDAVRNHGRVDLMKCGQEQDSTKVAVKRMPTKWVRPRPREFQESYPSASEKPWMDIGIVRYLNTVRFPFACDHLGVFRDEETTYVVTSLASEGDLFGWCDCDPGPGLAREDIMRPFAAQMFSAVRLLHRIGIAHRDLSLENILLTANSDGTFSIKLIDFGMCTLDRMCRKEIRGKQSYQAPEMHLEEEYDSFLTDSFALGVVLYAMGAQDYPWTSTKRHACKLYEYVHMYGLRRFLTKRKLRKGSGEMLSEVFSEPFTELLEGLLDKSSSRRVCMGEACFEAHHASPLSNGSDMRPRRSVWEMRWMEGCDDSCRDLLKNS